ncbi:MAG: type IV pilus biogenesis protein PilP [Burkholderiaceae bacterium]|nr:MAG: type IV pilus biogenesis protein PilP [Burkholderiaceae bacterium]
MASKTMWALLALCAGYGAAAQAQQATVGDLTRINSENVIKQAQVTGANLDAQLRKAGASADSSSTASASQLPGGVQQVSLVAPQAVAPKASASDTTPVVKTVFGANGVVYATFLYADGSTVSAKEGSTIPGGYRVAHVDVEHVSLAKGAKTFDVGFSASPPESPKAAAPAYQGPMGAFGSAGFPVPPPMTPAAPAPGQGSP